MDFEAELLLFFTTGPATPAARVTAGVKTQQSRKNHGIIWMNSRQNPESCRTTSMKYPGTDLKPEIIDTFVLINLKEM